MFAHERGHPGRPCRCCQLGEGLLVSVRARDQQVGLGCSCWREARDRDPTGQGSDRVCVGGSGGGGVALGFSPAALWEEVNKRKYLWREWGHDQGVGSGAVLLLPPEAPRPCTYPFGEGSLETASFLSPLLVSPHGYMESLPLLLKDMRVVGSRRGLRSWYWTREL